MTWTTKEKQVDKTLYNKKLATLTHTQFGVISGDQGDLQVFV